MTARRLSWARVRAHRLHSISLLLIVVVALLALTALQGIASSSGLAQAEYSLSRLPVGDQYITLASNRIISSEQERSALTARISQDLGQLTHKSATRQVLFHELSDLHGNGFYVGGIDDVQSKVTLTQGRLPTPCVSAPCEVIQIGGGNQVGLNLGSLGFSLVGHGKASDSQVFSGTYSTRPGSALYILNGVTSTSHVALLTKSQGSDGWILTINLRALRKLGVSGYVAAVARFQNQIASDYPEISMTWPQDALTEADDQSKTTTNTIGLINYGVAALFLGAILLFSMRQRKSHLVFRSGLSRVGVAKETIFRALFYEVGTPLLAAVTLWLSFTPLVASVLQRSGFPVKISALFYSAAADLPLLIAAIFATVAVTLAGDSSWKRQMRLPVFAATACFALYLVLSHTQFGGGLSIWLLPIFITVFLTIANYFLIEKLSFLKRKEKRSTFLLGRESISGWQSLASLVSVALLLALVALGYSSGSDRAVEAEATDQVPMAFRLTTGPSLVRPLDLGSLSQYEAISAHTSAFPILRMGSSVHGASSIADEVSLIGLPPAAFSSIHGNSLSRLGTLINSDRAGNEGGIALGGARQITIRVRNVPTYIDLIGWFRTPRDTHRSVLATTTAELRTLKLPKDLPSDSTLVALELRESSEFLSRRLHALGEGIFSVPMAQGDGHIVEMHFGQTLVSNSLWPFKAFHYAFDGNSLLLAAANQRSVPRVIADPTTAALAPNGLLTLSSVGGNSFRVKIVATTKSFPSAGERFVILDINQLQSEVLRADPGAADPIELWISTPDALSFQSALESSKYSQLTIANHLQVTANLRANPVDKALRGSYFLTLIFGVYLVLLMQFSAIPLLRREKGALLSYMETQGATPTDIARAIRSNARRAFAVGAVIGVACGVLLTRMYVTDSLPIVKIALCLLTAFIISEGNARYFTAGKFQ